MFISYKNLISGNFDEVDSNKLFILNRWASFNYKNYEITSQIDRLMLVVRDKELLKTLLGLKMHKQIPKYLKAEKDDIFLIDAAKRYFKFSQREYDMQKHLIVFDDKLIRDMAVKLGWDKKECRKYGVEWTEPKKQKLKKDEATKSRNLFSF